MKSVMQGRGIIGSETPLVASTLTAMSRLRDSSNGRRALQFGADALLAAVAYFLAFKLRFLDTTGGIPERYEDMLLGSIAFVAIGQAAVFEIFGQHQKWWRYFRLPDLWPLVRAALVAVALLVLVFAIAQPYPDDLPRSVVVFDLLLLTMLTARRPPAAAHPLRAPGAAPPASARRARSSSSAPARAARWSCARCSSTRTSATAPIGFVDDDPRKRGMHNLGLEVLGTTDEIAAICDRTKPDEVFIAIPSAPGTLRAKVVAACRERDIRVQTLPTVFELLRGGVQLTRQLREVQVEDVLGPRPGGDGARPRRRLPPGQDRARDRRRRLDRRRSSRARSRGCTRSCSSCSTTRRARCSRSTAS